ncbi:hypothetical protein ACOMHN_040815 [Nucella lapillus]
MGPFHRRASSLTEVQILVSVAKRGQNATFCIYSMCGTDQHGGVIQPWGTVSVRGVYGPRIISRINHTQRGLRFATDNLTDCYGAHTEASHRRHPQASSRPPQGKVTIRLGNVHKLNSP